MIHDKRGSVDICMWYVE